MNTVILLLCVLLPVLAASVFYLSDLRRLRQSEQDQRENSEVE